MINFEPVSDDLVHMATGHAQARFDDALFKSHDVLSERIQDSALLIIGASGSIGHAVVKLALSYGPSRVVLADINENELADLIRSLRIGTMQLPADLTTTICQLGSPAFPRFLSNCPPFDAILNLAAIKHVRSERDSYGVMRMCETNVLGTIQLVNYCSDNPHCRLFSVSTDKAVKPTNLMGATKRWMEKILAEAPASVVTSSARFANVAYSAGSLPASFADRIAQNQPVIAPSDIGRYFMSHKEAAQICLLAAFASQEKELVLPQVTASDIVNMRDLAIGFLESKGLTAKAYETEEEARRSPLLQHPDGVAWPCYFPDTDTTGEKTLEEMHYGWESLDTSRYKGLAVLPLISFVESDLKQAHSKLMKIIEQSVWQKNEIVDAIKTAVPEMNYTDQKYYLDQKV